MYISEQKEGKWKVFKEDESEVIFPMYKSKGERTECKNYRVRSVTEGLIDDEQGGFRAGRGWVDQIFTLKQVEWANMREKNITYVGFMELQ